MRRCVLGATHHFTAPGKSEKRSAMTVTSSPVSTVDPSRPGCASAAESTVVVVVITMPSPSRDGRVWVSPIAIH